MSQTKAKPKKPLGTSYMPTFDLFDYLAHDKLHLIVRRSEVWGLLHWVYTFDRRNNRWWQRLWRRLKGEPTYLDPFRYVAAGLSMRRKDPEAFEAYRQALAGARNGPRPPSRASGPQAGR